MSDAVFVTTLNLSLAERLRQDLIAQGFEITVPAYTLFSGRKKGISCTLYKSGKLTVQGKEKGPFIEFYLEPELLESFTFTHPVQENDIVSSARIGIDESGKGDFFGPLCIAGVFANGDEVAKLKEMGVRDSKDLSDSAIVKLAKQIQSSFAHHIVRINPAKYNEIYQQFKNLNHLLAWGHATAIENLVFRTKCKDVIIDQFAAEHVVINALKRKGLEINLSQRHRAEEDLVVAAASILARAAFLEGLNKLSEEYGIKLPKGASPAVIAAGRKFYDKYGKEKLAFVGKLHFKTLKVILG